jgi:DNA-binding response OmpR family regulator
MIKPDDARALLSGLSSRPPDDAASGSTEPTAVRILALTQDAGAWHTLQAVCSRSGWTLLWAHNCERAIALIEQHLATILICDRDLPGINWREAMARIAALPQPVCILLASRVADQYLWREVVDNRGFDLLVIPFDEASLVRSVRMACSWQGWKGREAATRRDA